MSDSESHLNGSDQVDQMSISEDKIANYLQNHPAFFDRYPSVLFANPASLKVEQSLYQSRQMRLIQTELVEAQKKVKHLYMLAKQSDQLNQITNELVSNIVKAKSFSQLEKNLQLSVRLMSAKGQSKLSLLDQLDIDSLDYLPEQIKDSIKAQSIHQMDLSQEQMKLLFGQSDDPSTKLKLWTVPLVIEGRPIGSWLLSVSGLEVYDKLRLEQLFEYVSSILIEKLQQLKNSVGVK